MNSVNLINLYKRRYQIKWKNWKINTKHLNQIMTKIISNNNNQFNTNNNNNQKYNKLWQNSINLLVIKHSNKFSNKMFKFSNNNHKNNCKQSKNNLNKYFILII